MHLDATGDAPGATGLAFQAADLAMKALTIAIDGSDAGSHQARMRRARQLVEADPSALELLWETRQRDFYGDAMVGGDVQLPGDAQVREALAVAAALDVQLPGDAQVREALAVAAALIDKIAAAIADARESPEASE
ncbi:MAG: hypothetical protein ACYC9X_12185 [Dehalococcoidia bacterium]